MIKKVTAGIISMLICQQSIFGQDINTIVKNAQLKIDKVLDYEADGTMKTNVTFLKIPVAKVKLYFKKPNRFKLKSKKGLSFIPKGSMSISLNNLFANKNFTVIDAGSEKINNTVVRIAKLLPDDENSDIILNTLYIDPANFLILKSKTTTKENGTYELKMNYNKYSKYGLPDEILFSFNTKDYKLPKGITFDFDDGNEDKKTTKLPPNKKGEISISISNYRINSGLAENIFK